MLKSDHSRVIVHIDIDCFYAQVEEIANPDLRTKNVGIKQKSCLVTCNYNARRFGVKKLMSVSDALACCPDLVMVNGEDLTKYKAMSDRIFDVLCRFTHQIEKLGMDENFIDVTKLLDGRETVMDPETFIEASDDGEECDCGCQERLKIGTVIAKEMRQAIFEELGVTTCAGIAYNKQLAKLVGSWNKPNKQTVIFDSAVAGFMRRLESVRSICGVGQKMAELLETFGIKTVAELQDASLENKKIDVNTAKRLKSWSMGVDNSEVKPSGKPKSLSIEDSTYGNPLKNLYEVETKFSALISKLLTVSGEDGRQPAAFRVTVRKTKDFKDLLIRESKQAPVTKNVLIGTTPEVILNLIQVAMNLFKKIVTEPTFSITLLGVGFTKFQEESNQKSTIEKFLQPGVSQRIPEKSPEVSPPSKKSKISDWLSKPGASASSPESPINLPPQKNRKNISDSPITAPPAKKAKLDVPSNVDLTIFNTLPEELKQELVAQWSTSPVTAKSNARKNKSSTLDRFLKPV